MDSSTLEARHGLPSGLSSGEAMARRSPQSYRFQIFTVQDVQCHTCGHESPRVSRLIWEEPPGREISMPVAQRVRMAFDRASFLADRDQIRLVVGTKSLFDESPFQSDTFITPTKSPQPIFDIRDRLLLTSGSGVAS